MTGLLFLFSETREALHIPQDDPRTLRDGGVECDLALRLDRLARRAAASAQVHLAWLEIEGSGRGRRVRVFIERPDARVGIADCERMDERFSALLALEDPIPGSWTLEVSTPGLDRPLRSLEDCRRFCGRRVRVTYRTEKRRKTGTGTLRAVEDAAVRLASPGGDRRIPWSAVVAARLDPDLATLFGGSRGSAGRDRS